MVEYYSKRFSKLRTSTSAKHWSERTRRKAPHKALLLLVVIDHFAQGSISTNLLELNTDLIQTFASYWSKVMPAERRGNISYPFFHLRSEPFWHLIPKPAKTSQLEKKTTVSSVSELNELILGATLDEELYNLLLNETDRETLRKVLVETYFAPELQHELLAKGEINVKAFQYSLELVEPKKMPKIKDAAPGYSAPVRDQGFRLALVKVYNHRCTVCGIRALTPEGHTVIEAAHIIPWSISHNDNPRNGVALCKLCHWMFDECLLTISKEYAVMISPQLSANQNIPGHLVTLDGRGIVDPINEAFLPEVKSLNWHYREVFRAKKEGTLR